MVVKRRREKLLTEVRAQVRRRLEQPLSDLKRSQEALAYLAWLLQHCRRFAALPCFLDAAGSDIVAILYAGAVGLERSAYLHSRSLLENLVRHFYYDSRPSLFVTRSLASQETVQDRYAELFEEIQKLPHFRAAFEVAGETESTDAKAAGEKVASEKAPAEETLFGDFHSAYQEACRFVHGAAPHYRSLHESVGAITMDSARTKALEKFLRHLCDGAISLLALYHLGPYLLISQPIRRHLLMQVRAGVRERFLTALSRISLTWSRHQRSAALATLRERRRGAVATRDGLLFEKSGVVRVASPVGLAAGKHP